MKSPIFFKGDAKYAYSSGVVRGLESYLLTKADFNKLIDAPTAQMGAILSEFGYGGGEVEPEHVLDNAIKFLFDEINRITLRNEFTQIWQLRFDLLNFASALKSQLYDIGKFTFIPWGKHTYSEVSSAVSDVVSNTKTNLDPFLGSALENALRLHKEFLNTVVIDLAIDKAFGGFVLEKIPKGDFFSRWYSLMADWMNTKNFVRISLAGIPQKLFWAVLWKPGSLYEGVFASLWENSESASVVLVRTDYGKQLGENVAKSMKGELYLIDNYFNSLLKELYRYTRFCPYGLEVVWAYLCVKLEEISILRKIVRSKLAGISPQQIREVVFAVE